ncbi:class I poly(R)-hydroxyalkanoic acid synthase [uncultured Ferrimonas sp.]|uniref:class I poly(R)-hydroxyalkanoic acid synthase n=1 Tax=uncultured Ferrimonas sp. TaxID=432640 RepID=UPI002628B2C8|nr:class I poly(R)-hydroxyalkanoic acid synthase [uncultured Ferrimonas sp.]
MDNGSYQKLLDSLLQCNQHFMDLAQGQGQLASQAVLQQSVQDINQAIEKTSAQPQAMVEQQLQWWQSQLQLFQNTMLRHGGQPVEPLVQPQRGDKRFGDERWSELPWFDYIKQSYLLTAQQMQQSIDAIDDLDEASRQRLQFFTRQAVNAMAPSNFLGSNPELLQLTLESGGDNLRKGMEQLSQDLLKSAGALNVSMTDSDAYQLGRDLAVSPGKVVHQTELYQLLQYSPSTEQVAKRPLLIVPPFVNKYYILDLQQRNSMVKYLVDQGHTVMMISWLNPDERHQALDFDDYVVDGVLSATETIEKLTGETEINAVGYCIGGTALACAMAYASAKRMKQRIKSATFFTTILDFSQPGELGAFINDTVVSALEQQNLEQGIMDGRQLAVAFSLLKENNLYWNYYIDGYLKGKSPVAFDILHWNCDNTNVSGKNHNTMLRRFYLNNELMQADAFTVRGVGIDLSRIKVPTLFVSTVEDHIALWQGTYSGMQQLGGDKTFILGESGHVAGIVNPPGGKYNHYLGAGSNELDAEQWLAQTQQQAGSWWPSWMGWLAERNVLDPVAARTLDDSLDNAPGSYVMKRLASTMDNVA